MTTELHYRRLRRIRLVFAGLTGLAVVLALALMYWQILPGDKPEDWALAQVTDYRTRGSVLDNDGHYLALDTVVYELDLYPDQITVTETITGCLALVEDLSAIVDIESPELLLQELTKRESRQIIIDRHLGDDVRLRIEQMGLGGVHLEPSFIRCYPEDELFGPVIGLTLWASATGISGIEGYYKPELTGRDPKGWEGFSPPLETAGGRRGIAGEQETRRVPLISDLPQLRDGADLHTTLDRNVQRIVYDALQEGVLQSRAVRGLAIVMDPCSGKVRAVANYPSFDPNRYPDYWPDQAANLVDYSVTGTYEPGSVIKIMTVAAAMNEGLITAGTTFNDTGEITVGPKTIYNWNRKSYGLVNTVEVLAYSLNVEAAAIAQMLQPATFYEYMRRFGFGEPTRIDLAAELLGEFRVPGEREWNMSDLATNSFGQGFTATPMSVITAVSVVANDGKRMRPYIVERIVQEGDERTIEPQVVCEEVISPQTARELSRMMAEAIETNVPKAVVPGYTIAGKSGTSEVAIGGRYHPTRTIASFVGFGPLEDPRFAILVKLDDPKTSEYGSVVAAPVFSRVAAALFAYYDIPPTSRRRR